MKCNGGFYVKAIKTLKSSMSPPQLPLVAFEKPQKWCKSFPCHKRDNGASGNDIESKIMS